MGEIKKFDFNKDRGEKPEDKKDEKWWKDKEKQPLLFVKFAKFLISENATKIKNLKITPEAFSQAKQTVKNYTTDELVAWLYNTNETDWQVKPSFFTAIIEELKTRIDDKDQWI